MPTPEVVLKDIPERTVAYLKCRGPWRQLPEMIAKIEGLMAQRGLKAIGPPCGVYHDTTGQTAAEKLDWEVFRPVEPGTPDRTDDGIGFGIKTLGPIRTAAVIHTGSFRKTGPTYIALTEWLDEHRLRICGPNEEVYLTGIGENLDETKIEIRFPVC